MMQEKFDRERSSEVLKITRIHEEGAWLLAHELKSGGSNRGPTLHRGAFRVPEREREPREKPGTTTQGLNFLKDVYRKFEDEPSRPRQAQRPPEK